MFFFSGTLLAKQSSYPTGSLGCPTTAASAVTARSATDTFASAGSAEHASRRSAQHISRAGGQLYQSHDRGGCVGLETAHQPRELSRQRGPGLARYSAK